MNNLVYNPALLVDYGYSSPNLQSKEKSYSKEPPYKCKFCGRGFLNSSKLQVHERIHTGERPYKCKFCDRTFTQKAHLKAHERTHTGGRLFQCKYCGRSFTVSRNLKNHLRSFHSFAFSSSNQNSEHSTELQQNRGPVNFTSNVADQHLNFDKILFEGNNINSQAVFYHSPQPGTSEGFELENRNYVSIDEVYKCRLCSYSFRDENELNLHYITHFDNL